MLLSEMPENCVTLDEAAAGLAQRLVGADPRVEVPDGASLLLRVVLDLDGVDDRLLPIAGLVLPVRAVI